MSRNAVFICACTAVTFIGTMLWLWLGCPQYLLYHEQNQLFLFTWNYFADRIAVPGGLADYISEFIVQFCYVPVYGAALAALVLTLSQVFLGMACSHIFIENAALRTAYVLAGIPAVLYLGAMGDENVLFSYAVAMTLTTLFIWLSTHAVRRGAFSMKMRNDPARRGAFSMKMRGEPARRGAFSMKMRGECRRRAIVLDSFILSFVFFILYWLAGPIAFAYIIAAGILSTSQRHFEATCFSLTVGKVPSQWLAAVISLALAFLFVFCVHTLWFQQYPLSRLLSGLNYCRVPEVYPTILYVIASVIALYPAVTYLKGRTFKGMPYVAEGIVLVFAFIYVPASIDKDKANALTYDSLVRQGRWEDIIEKARKERPTDLFSIQALNLALGMTGQLTESMFTFDQQGVDSLIGKDKLDNTTQLVSAEALYRLGLTNIAFSTTFDLQEAIMNDRKSGRHMKRMAECMIINGRYEVAAKYIGFLEKSLFYRDWARQAKALLGIDRAVEAHPVYGPLRRNGFKKEALYDHTQLDKILAMLALDREGHNRLAWEYFCAAEMLKGDLATLAGAAARYQGQQRMPRHMQEAMAMYWTFSHPDFNGIPFPISGEVRQETAALAQAASRGGGNPSAWRNAAPGSYGVYFLTLMQRQNPPAQKM